MHIPPERILASSQTTSKKALLTELASLFTSMDPDLVLESVTAREKLGSTGIGHGVAIPHCRLADLPKARLALARHQQGVDFDAIDGAPVHIVVMLLVPDNDNKQNLALLAALARHLQQQQFRHAIMQADSVEAISDLFQRIDSDGSTSFQ